MGRIAYFDCFSGASGDMIIGALLDAGLELKDLQRELGKLRLRGCSLSAKKVARGGFSATKFDVEVPHREGGRSHRKLADILGIIRKSRLSDNVKRCSERIFRRLAGAEARAHGVAPGRIHFHEVGAVDAIVDIVGAVAGLELLGVTKIFVSPIATGSGYVECAHGRLPVPAPATAYLLEGFPAKGTDVVRELTTPTGAAILTTLADGFGGMPAMHIAKVGCGAGTAEGERVPNLLRVFLGASMGAGAEGYESDVVTRYEANIDDATPETCARAVERLMDAGALDAWLSPAAMKKGRSAWTLHVLCENSDAAKIADVIFRETTTFGVRVASESRLKLARKIVSVKTRYGVVKVKVGMKGGEAVTASPEYEDCRRAAESRGVAFRDVYEAAKAALRRRM
jgi:hypothetical protein